MLSLPPLSLSPRFSQISTSKGQAVLIDVSPTCTIKGDCAEAGYAALVVSFMIVTSICASAG